MKSIAIISILCICTLSFAQRIEQNILHGAGAFVSTDQIYLQWTLGDLIIRDQQLNGLYISEGFQSAEQPDLVTFLSVDDQKGLFQRGALLNLFCRIVNLSNASVYSPFSNSIFLSRDSVISVDDQIISFEKIESLSASDSIEIYESFQVPVHIDTGHYFLICSTDSEDDIFESHENNNLSFVQIRIVDYPDLVISSFQVSPVSTPLSGKVELNGVISNLGLIESNQSQLKVILSTDEFVDKEDLAINFAKIPALAPGQEFQWSHSFVPFLKGIVPGKYFLHICLDPDNQIAEVNEDNCEMQSILILDDRMPDFRIDSVVVLEPCIVPGSNITVRYKLTNQGSATAGPSESGILLSQSSSIGTDSVIIHRINHNSILEPGAFIMVEEMVRIPTNATAGQNSLIVCADIPERILESDENNNCNFDLIEVHANITECKPDIAICDVHVSGVCHQPGSNINVIGQMKNLSPQPTGKSSFLRFYVSQDAVLDQNDRQIHHKWVPSIGGLANIAFDENMQIPSTISSGSYFILVCYDIEEQISEESEDNNCGNDNIIILGLELPDLSITNLVIIDECLQYNNSFLATFRISNLGFTTSDFTNVKYFLSIDNQFSDDDHFIYEHDLTAIQPCDYQDLNEVIFLNSNIAHGTYFLIVHIDADDFILESNESNNISAIQTLLKSVDLELQKEEKGLVEVFTGSIDSFKINIKNIGNIDAGTFYSGVFYSDDDQFDPSDELIGYKLVGPLAIEEEESIHLTVNITKEEESTFYLIFVVNFLESVVEANRSNNTCSLKIKTKTKKKPEIDLIEYYYFQENVGRLNPFSNNKKGI